jgi:hypothetical protein
MRVFLTWHGGCTPNDGYFTLPAKTRVVFYTENAKLMLAGDVFKIVDGTYNEKPDQVIEPFMNCQNMTLYPDDAQFVAPTLAACRRNPDAEYCTVYDVDTPTKLKDIVTENPGHEFVWACCRDLSLNSVKGSTLARDIGLNAVQTGGQIINYDKSRNEMVLAKWQVRYKKALAF